MRVATEFDIKRLSKIERINIIGTSGSGKSTLGRHLATIVGLPFIEMDSVYWGPNWKEPTDEAFISKIRSITERPRWVLDGNYSRTTPVKWRYVQLVVWLDLSFVRTVARVSVRCLSRALTQTEIWPNTGNRETLRKSFFSRESVVLWAITSYRRNRQRYSERVVSRDYPEVWFVRLKSQRDINAFLETARMAAEQRDTR